ncbi:MAG: UpxY family transcription antiterminator [Chitinophagaceae bacterium]
MEDKKWFVIYSKPRWEKKIDAALLRKGIESWCPLNKIEKQWSDRKKIIEEPLFKSYVFVKISENERTEVLMTPGVLNFIYHQGKPAVIRDIEINNIKKYLLLDTPKVEIIDKAAFKESTKVRISHGVFLDAEGTVVRSGKKKVYVKIESLNQVLTVEFKSEYLISV